MPNNWKKHKLSEIAEVKYGKDHKHLAVGEIPVYGSGGIMRYADKALYEEESVLIPRKGTLSNLFYLDKPFWSVDTMFYTKLSNQISGKYFYYNLKTLDFAGMDVGSAVPSLTTELLNRIEITLPPLKEQQAIAEILSALDDKIELNLQSNKTLENMANALYKHWFVDFGPFLPKGRCLKDGGGDIPGFVESELGLIPEGWEVKKLDEVIRFTKGKKPNKVSNDFQEGFLPQILISSFDESHSGYALAENVVISNDLDLLMVMDGSGSGRTEIGFPGIVGSTISRIDFKKEFEHLRFVTYLLLRANQQLIKENTTGTSIPHTDKGFVFNFSIAFPSVKTIDLFNTQISSLIQLIKSNFTQNKELKQTRDYLLPKLISGEIRVKEATKKVKDLV